MTDVTTYENHINFLKEKIENKRLILELTEHPSFKRFITEGFCKEEMSRLMGLAISQNLDANTRELCNQLAKASAALEAYIGNIVRDGVMAEEELPEVEEALENERNMQEEE